MQMRLLLTPIREVAECASIPHLPECFTGSTQWSPPLSRPTGNYWEPERERARGVRVSGRHTCHFFFSHVIFCQTEGWVAHRVKCKCCLLPHPFLQNPHAQSVTGNYSMRVAALYVRLEGQAHCLLPQGHWASPLWLDLQSVPLVPCLSDHLLCVVSSS